MKRSAKSIRLSDGVDLAGGRSLDSFAFSLQRYFAHKKPPHPMQADVGLALAPEIHRSRANVAHIRQSRPDHGLGLHVEVLGTCEVVPLLHVSGQV